MRRIMYRSCGVLILSLVLSGCAAGGGGLAVSQVGSYSTAPAITYKPRLGITAFQIEGDATSESARDLSDAAADDMAELIAKSGRFDVLGRVATKQLLEQQGAADAIKPGVLLHPVDIKGIDFLLVGSLNNLSVTRQAASPDMLHKMEHWVQQSSQKRDVIVTAHCGVGFNVIDPSTGDIMLSNNSEFERTAPAASLGLDVMQTEQQAATTLPVTQEDRQRIIRLAIDDAVRKSLPKTDRFLASRAGMTASSAMTSNQTPSNPPTPAAPPPTAPAAKLPTTAPAGAVPASPQSTAAYKICPVCGAKNDPAAKFCKQCGAKLP